MTNDGHLFDVTDQSFLQSIDIQVTVIMTMTGKARRDIQFLHETVIELRMFNQFRAESTHASCKHASQYSHYPCGIDRIDLLHVRNAPQIATKQQHCGIHATRSDILVCFNSDRVPLPYQVLNRTSHKRTWHEHCEKCRQIKALEISQTKIAINMTVCWKALRWCWPWTWPENDRCEQSTVNLRTSSTSSCPQPTPLYNHATLNTSTRSTDASTDSETSANTLLPVLVFTSAYNNGTRCSFSIITRIY